MASSNRGIQIGSAWFQRKMNLRPQHRGVHLVTEEILRQMPEICQFSVGLFHVQNSEEEINKQRTVEKKQETINLTPLFLIFKHKEEGLTLSKTSPFLINKAFASAGGQPTSIRKLRNGTLLVEAANEVQAQKFLKMTSFFDQVLVTVEPHATLNSSKGIVFYRELLDCSIEEIKSELQSEHVTDVIRIMRKESGKLVPTSGLIITFALPKHLPN